MLNQGNLQLNLSKKQINEPVSKRFSLVKVKESENFNHRNTLSILRIKI